LAPCSRGSDIDIDIRSSIIDIDHRFSIFDFRSSIPFLDHRFRFRFSIIVLRSSIPSSAADETHPARRHRPPGGGGMWLLAPALAADWTPADVPVQTAGAIVVDGVLDEPSWTAATPHGDFRRFLPVDGDAPPGVTALRFLQDDRYLYVGIQVSQADYPIRAHVVPREDINVDDQIGIYLDTFLDGVSGYIFYFNALGIQQDIRHNAGDWNVAWDTLLKSRGTVTDDGYTLEIAFPWRSLKFPSERVAGGETQTWGLLVTRKIPGEGAKYGWPKQDRGAPRLFQRANHLVDVRPPRRGSGLELIPALTATTPFPRPDDQRPLDVLRPSLDARFGITPDIGLAATLNPDFSQVESDVSDIRLNARFAFAFPERRPFFLDGIDWFQDAGDTLYTRSMNEPLYGVKISGREGPVSLGALQVLDRTPLASFNEARTPGFTPEDVDGAMASTSLVRTRIDAFDGGFAGLTLADKRLVGRSGTHQLGGIDLNVPLGDRWIAQSALQHSLTGDAVERIWGTRTWADVRRATGIGTGGGVYFANNSPGYRNEVGFTTQSDRTDAGVLVNHTFTPEGLVDIVRPGFFADTTVEGNGDRWWSAGGGVDTTLNGVHQVNGFAWVQDFVEGGEQVPGYGAGAGWSSNLGAAVDVGLNAEAERVIDYFTLLPANNGQVSTTLDLRPTAGIQSATTLTLNQFASGDTKQVSMLLRNRVNWQFSRELGMRWILDYSRISDRDPRLYNDLLLTWLRNPGTAFWLGGNLVDTPDGLQAGLFLKATVLLRP
jgi:hypothetical protein